MTSLLTKDKMGKQEERASKNAGVKKKAQCDLCKLSYSTEKELMEHLLSLMHHTKMEDKEDNPVHACTLCKVNCSDMAEYRRHIALDSHLKKLNNQRGNDHEQEAKGKSENRNSGFRGHKPPVPYKGSSDYVTPGNLRGPRNKFAPRVSQQGWNPRGRPPRFGANNAKFHWKRNGYTENRWRVDDEMGDRNYSSMPHDHPDDRPERKNKNPRGSGSGTYFEYENERAHQRPWRQNQWHGGLDMPHHDYPEYDYPFQYMDFTSGDPQCYWDDFYLSQREQFVASMDSYYPNGRPSRRWQSASQSQQGHLQSDYQSPRSEDIRDRKRPRNEDDIQESYAKSSRSIDHSSDENIPVRDVPRTESRISHITQSQKNNSKTVNDNSAHPASLDDASNNILERAERLCKELRKKREASQAHQRKLLKSQEQELLNEKMHALVQKQRSYLKGHIKDSETTQVDENYDSGVSSTSTQQSKRSGVSPASASSKSSLASNRPLIKPISTGKTLEEIRKSIEKSVLDDANKTVSAAHRKQRTFSGGDIGRTVSKPSPKPQLTKDSLKKMVNAPRSRDERLQLAKMLQGREGHKSGPSPASRANLQLEGLYDSAIGSDDRNTDIDSNSTTAQTIKLEDLADDVRQQILDLIGGDIGGNIGSQSEIDIGGRGLSSSPIKIRASPKQYEVMILSDDDSKSGHKDNHRTCIVDEKASSTGHQTNDSGKLKKTKKSSAGLNVRSTRSAKTSNSGVDILSKNSKQAISVRQSYRSEDRAMVVSDSESDVEVVSCSSDKDSGSRERVHREEYTVKDQHVSGSSSRPESRHAICSASISSSPEGGHSLGSVERASDALSASKQSQLTSDNVREKFPLLMSLPGGDKTSVADEVTERISSNDYIPSATPSALPSSSLPEKISSSSSHQIKQTSFSTETPQSQRLSLAPGVWLTSESSSPLTSESYRTTSTVPVVTTTAAVSTTSRLTYSSSSPRFEINEPNMAKSLTAIRTNFSSSVSSPPSRLFDSAVSTDDPKRDHIPNNDKSKNFSSTFTSAMSRDKSLSTSGDLQDSNVANIDTRGNQHFLVERLSLDSAGLYNETSSQAMSDLLVLSEREEDIKQEMMSMELRLTRLHRLLEQAVVQINKCTERRNQLLEEEQDISKQRLSLLRDAASASSRQSLRSDASDVHNISFLSDTSTHESLHTDRSGQHQKSTHTTFTSPRTLSGGNSSVSSLEKPGDGSGTSLSKEDWLAKFSSYLPQDPALTTAVTRSNVMTTNSILYGTSNSLSSSSTLSTINLTGSQPSSEFVPEKDSGPAQGEEDAEMTTQGETFSQTSSSRADLQNLVRSSVPGNSSTKEDRMQSTSPNSSTASAPISTASTTTSAMGLGHVFSSPIMYVGSFRNISAPVKLTISTFGQSNFSTSTTTNAPQREAYFPPYSRQDSVASSGGADSAGEKHVSTLEDLMSLPSPSRSHEINNIYGHGGEESDIGSVASSIASGSSLGEHITRYCRSTPGASLDIREPSGMHELSVIMSDTSERRGFDSQLEDEEENNDGVSYVRKEDWFKAVRPCSVSLERLNLQSKTDIYGKLDKDAVKSAEVLHLMERNHEDSGSLAVTDNWKKKKRKTRQERETSGLTRRRRHWVLSSSSDDGEAQNENKSSPDISISAVTSREKRDGLLSSQENDSSDTNPRGREGKGTVADQLKQELSSPTRTNGDLAITIAECDSSTNLGMVDSESITNQVNTLKEMRDSFVRTYGRSPRLSRLSQSQENIRDVNSTSGDALVDDPISDQLEGSDSSTSAQHWKLQAKGHSLPLTDGRAFSLLEKKTASQDCLIIDDETGKSLFGSADNITTVSTERDCSKPSLQKPLPQMSDFSEKSDSVSRNIMTCKFRCVCGPVLDIHVEDRHLYVAHSNHGICVHDMKGLPQGELVNKYSFPRLHCMYITKLNEISTIILGNGCELVFFKMEEEKQSCYNLDAVVKCLVMIGPVLYAGMDTGKIGLFDTKKMQLKEEIICSDHPIHCLATAQEGTTRLLCASAQDGSILVMDAHNCLPIRLLTGHTKTAFSIHAAGSYLYSGSGSGTVLVHNLHTAAVEHTYKDNKGLVKSVFYSNGLLFTGGMDKLVRCYNTETHQLLQVLFGPERRVITKVLVHDDMVITGNISGSVDVVELCPDATYKCSKKGCSYNFGNKSHLFQHLMEDHEITQQ